MDTEKLVDNTSAKSEVYGISYRKTWVRYIALAMACLVMIGSYMCYDFPAYLNN